MRKPLVYFACPAYGRHLSDRSERIGDIRSSCRDHNGSARQGRTDEIAVNRYDGHRRRMFWQHKRAGGNVMSIQHFRLPEKPQLSEDLAPVRIFIIPRISSCRHISICRMQPFTCAVRAISLPALCLWNRLSPAWPGHRRMSGICLSVLCHHL